MSRNRFKKTALFTIAGIALLLALVALLFVFEHTRTHVEEGAVLSALFSQGVLHDMDKWRAGRTITIVVMRNPSCRICTQPAIGLESQSWFAQSLKARERTLSDAWFAESSRTTRTSFYLNSVFSRDLATDLRLPNGARAVFVNSSAVGTKAGDLEAKFPDNFGFFVVSHVGLNLNKNEALLYVDHFCGGWCGGGGYVLLRKEDGVWHVVDRHDMWVS